VGAMNATPWVFTGCGVFYWFCWRNKGFRLFPSLVTVSSCLSLSDPVLHHFGAICTTRRTTNGLFEMTVRNSQVMAVGNHWGIPQPGANHVRWERVLQFRLARLNISFAMAACLRLVFSFSFVRMNNAHSSASPAVIESNRRSSPKYSVRKCRVRP